MEQNNEQVVSIFDNGTDFVPQFMRADIREKEGHYLIEIELPGFSHDNVTAELKDGYLTITAKKSDILEKEETKIHYIHKERIVYSGKRTFFVGTDVTEEDIQATFRDGVLGIMIINEKKPIDGVKRKFIPIY